MLNPTPKALAACAALALTFATTYLRAGPGEHYAVLDELAPHTDVDVLSCDAGWCRVRLGRIQGFIGAHILSAPDIHAKPGAAAGPCVIARVNGRPRGGDTVRVCDER